MDLAELKKKQNRPRHAGGEEKDKDKGDLIKARLGTYFQRYNKYSRKAKKKLKALKGGVYDDSSSAKSKVLEDDAKHHPEYFKQQLENADVSRFRFERYSRIDDAILKALLTPMQDVVHALIDCKVADEAPITEETLQLSEAGTAALAALRAFNWSYSIES